MMTLIYNNVFSGDYMYDDIFSKESLYKAYEHYCNVDVGEFIDVLKDGNRMFAYMAARNVEKIATDKELKIAIDEYNAIERYNKKIKKERTNNHCIKNSAIASVNSSTLSGIEEAIGEYAKTTWFGNEKISYNLGALILNNYKTIKNFYSKLNTGKNKEADL